MIHPVPGFRFPDEEILRPTCDVAFKAMFMKNKEITRSLIEAFIRPDKEIVDLDFLNTDLSPERERAKSVRLDVAVKLSDGTVIDVEMQTTARPGLRKRSIAYAAKLLSPQMDSGVDYLQQPNVVSLFLMDENFVSASLEDWRHSYELRKESGELLSSNAFRIDFVELQKAKRLKTSLDSLFSSCVEFFTAATYEDLKQISAGSDTLRQAREVLEMVSKDKQAWSDARAIWEGEFEVKNSIWSAKQEGLEEGKEIGREEGLKIGEEIGLEKGKEEASRALASKLLKKRLSEASRYEAALQSMKEEDLASFIEFLADKPEPQAIEEWFKAIPQ